MRVSSRVITDRIGWLLKDCQGTDFADNARKVDENCQKLPEDIGIKDMIEERCNSRSAKPASRSRLEVSSTSGINVCETVDADALEVNMNEEWR